MKDDLPPIAEAPPDGGPTADSHALLPQGVRQKVDVRCQELAADVYLLTYTLRQQGVRISRRATIWRRFSDGWKIVFHQGTIVQDP